MKRRLPTIDAAEKKRNAKVVTQEEGWEPRIIPSSPRILVGNDERAPAKDVTDSDIPPQFLGSTRGGGNKDALGCGKGKRKQAPV